MRLSPTEVRDLLDAERSRTLARLDTLGHEHRGFVDASRDTNADDEHDPEGTTIAFERSQVGSLLRQAERHLAEIDAAFARLADTTADTTSDTTSGTAYGVCATCGDLIPDERLRARPTATTCVGCG